MDAWRKVPARQRRTIIDELGYQALDAERQAALFARMPQDEGNAYLVAEWAADAVANKLAAKLLKTAGRKPARVAKWKVSK